MVAWVCRVLCLINWGHINWGQNPIVLRDVLVFCRSAPCARWFLGACATPIAHGVGSYMGKIGVRSLLFFILALNRNTRFAGEMGSASREGCEYFSRLPQKQ